MTEFVFFKVLIGVVPEVMSYTFTLVADVPKFTVTFVGLIAVGVPVDTFQFVTLFQMTSSN